MIVRSTFIVALLVAPILAQTAPETGFRLRRVGAAEEGTTVVDWAAKAKKGNHHPENTTAGDVQAAVNSTAAAANATATTVANAGATAANATAAVLANVTAAAPGVVDFCNPPSYNNCSDEYEVFKKTLQSADLSDKVKDKAIERFCSSNETTACGQLYTKRIKGIFSGVCPVHTNHTHHNQSATSTNTTHRLLHDLEPHVRRSLDDSLDFLSHRWGAPLSCLADADGNTCVALKGCDFWKSCCAATWAATAAKSGKPFPHYFFSQIEAACNGASSLVKNASNACPV